MTGAALYASAHLQSADFLMQRHFNGRVFLFLPDGTYTQVQDYPDAVSPMVR
jgi:hypothetical protein